jgi:hypothetical protein
VPGLLLGLAVAICCFRRASFEARAVVVRPFVHQLRNLDFSRIIPTTAAGTVTISPANVHAFGIVLVGNDYRFAALHGRGVQNQRVRIRSRLQSLHLLALAQR